MKARVKLFENFSNAIYSLDFMYETLKSAKADSLCQILQICQKFRNQKKSDSIE